VSRYSAYRPARRAKFIGQAHRGPVDHRAKRMLRRKGTPYGHFPCIQAPFPAEPVPRVPQHPPDEMPDEGATTGTSHHARLQARASASAANSCAPALDDEQARRPRLLLLDKGSPLQCQHDAHGSPGGPTRDHWFLPAIRATTHLEGKASGSSRRRTPAARPEQARAGPATRGAHIWAKASAGTRRRLLAGSMDAGRTSSLLLARSGFWPHVARSHQDCRKRVSPRGRQ
jgi:hypothetical protein